MAGIFGEFFLVSVSHETKHEKSSKNSGKIRSKIRGKIRDENSKNSGNFRSATFLCLQNVTFDFCIFCTVPCIDCQVLAGERSPKETRTDHEAIQIYTFQK